MQDKTLEEFVGQLNEAHTAPRQLADLKAEVESLRKDKEISAAELNLWAKDHKGATDHIKKLELQVRASESAMNVALIALHCAKAAALISACKTADKDEIIGFLDDAIDGLEKHESQDQRPSTAGELLATRDTPVPDSVKRACARAVEDMHQPKDKRTHHYCGADGHYILRNMPEADCALCR